MTCRCICLCCIIVRHEFDSGIIVISELENRKWEQIMQDLNVVLIVLGVIVTGLYLRYNQPGRIQENGDHSLCPVGLAGNDIPETKDLFVLQYEQINERLRFREAMTFIVGSLFLTVSVLLLCSSIMFQQTVDSVLVYVLVFASFAFYSIWLLGFDLAANTLNNRELFQLRQMEKRTENGLNLHLLLEDTKDKGWERYLVRHVWIFPFWILIAVGVLILDSML